MADDQQYGSRADNKRKYEDPVPAAAVPRRPTGFSSAPPVASPSPDKGSAPPPSYNTVPPPADPIQLAKQRAQEVAARLFSDAEAKRPRFENGGAAADDGGVKSFGAPANDYPYKPLAQNIPGVSSPTSFPLYGYPGASKKIDIPQGRVGVIIGKGGETIKYLQLQSGAKIQVTRDSDADPSSQTRPVELVGTAEQVSKAEQLIKDVLEQAEAGGPPAAAARNFVASQPGTEHFSMKIPNHKVGLIIGKGGETIKSMQARSGAHIQVVPLHLPPGDTSTERNLHIGGTPDQIETAKQLVGEILDSDTRGRNQSGYRPPRPQTSWAPPGPPAMQQPGYGYMQPGAYPGAPPQYNMQQPAYGGYPSQPMPGYTGWDQTGNVTQQGAPAPSYDYSQQGQTQQAPAAQQGYGQPADHTAYNYGQPPVANYNQQGAYGDASYTQQQQAVAQQQGYGQDGGYSGGYGAPAPQSGYAQQPPSTAQAGYNQSSYGSAPYSSSSQDGSTPSTAQPGYNQNSYGSALYANSSQDGTAPTYAASQAAASQAPVPAPVPAPAQAPAAAAAAQTPAGTQGQGYASQPPAGTAYPQVPGYGMPPASQPAYGSQPLTAPTSYGQPAPVTQPAYGQTSPAQKPSPSPGYSQPPYSSSQPPAAAPGYSAPPGYASVPQQGYGQPQSYGSAPPPQGQAAGGYGQPPQQQPAYPDPYASGSGGYAAQPQYAGSDSAVAGSAPPATASQPPAAGIKASPHAQS